MGVATRLVCAAMKSIAKCLKIFSISYVPAISSEDDEWRWKCVLLVILYCNLYSKNYDIGCFFLDWLANWDYIVNAYIKTHIRQYIIIRLTNLYLPERTKRGRYECFRNFHYSGNMLAWTLVLWWFTLLHFLSNMLCWHKFAMAWVTMTQLCIDANSLTHARKRATYCHEKPQL